MENRISTGIQGLDKILLGGLIPQRAYSVCGQSGTGKTTLGLHFLSAGLAAGERVLMITFGQPADHIRADAKSIGIDLSAAKILDLTPAPETFSEDHIYDIFSPAEVERGPITSQISEGIREGKPTRIFVDGFGRFEISRETRFIIGVSLSHSFNSRSGRERHSSSLRIVASAYVMLMAPSIWNALVRAGCSVL